MREGDPRVEIDLGGAMIEIEVETGRTEDEGGEVIAVGRGAEAGATGGTGGELLTIQNDGEFVKKN